MAQRRRLGGEGLDVEAVGPTGGVERAARRGRRAGRCRRGAGRPCGRAPRRSRARARPRAPAAPGGVRARGCRPGSSLCGSSHGSRPSTWQAVTVSSRRTPSSGRAKTPKPGRIPCSDRPPEPRARPSSTVSAWSSRVWPSSTRRAESRSATSSRTAYLASRAAASGPSPDEPSTCDAGGQRLVDADRRELGHDPVGLVGGAGLEAVVDGDADDAQAELVPLEDRGRGEGQRVGAAAARDRHDVTRVEPAESAARTGTRTAATDGWSVTGRG